MTVFNVVLESSRQMGRLHAKTAFQEAIPHKGPDRALYAV
jgi:hypothetical protein